MSEASKDITLVVTRAIDELLNMNTKQKAVYNALSGKLETIMKNDTGTFTLSVQRADLEHKHSTGGHVSKVIILALEKFNRQNHFRDEHKRNRSVTITLDEYIEKTGMSDSESGRKNARRSILRALDMLYNSNINYRPHNNKYVEDFRILSHKKIKNSVIHMNFTEEFADFLNSRYAFIKHMPVRTLQIDGRNSLQFNIMNKLTTHYSNNNNKKRGTHDIISVRSLLASLYSIPKEEDVKDRRHTELIIQPLEKALDSLAGRGLLQWEYCQARKKPLDAQGLAEQNYRTIKDLYITFNLK